MKQQPYIPKGKQLKYVSMQNKFMQAAMQVAKEHSLYKQVPVGIVIVKNGKIISQGANGSTYHEQNGCVRRQKGIPHGQQYELCPGCSYKNHAEPKAINSAKSSGIDIKGADVYMWGEWWCCEPCWQEMLKAEIKDVYALKGSDVYFDGNDAQNKLANYHYFEKLKQ